MLFNKVKYLGGLPYPLSRVGMIDIFINNSQQTISFISSGSGSMVFHKRDIIDVETEEKFDRSIGKGVVGYVIGNIINKRYGGLLGAAIGARRKNVSMVYIRYSWNNRQNTIVLNPGKKAWDIYAAIKGFII